MTTPPSGARAIFPPVFATNRPERGETVAAEINRLLRGKRKSHRAAQPIAIATAYLNPAGIALLLDELERAPRVRLLLGAEPDRAMARPATAGLNRDELRQALRLHEAWLAAERDLTGFSREADGAARRLVEWLRKPGPGGAKPDGRDDRLPTGASVAESAEDRPRVEVRRYEDGFLHGKAFLVEHEIEPAVLAGSSNLTHAGLMTNAELNLGYPSGHHTHLVQDWFGHFWERSAPFPLADLYASRWDPHSPWIVFLRMLWEFYGRDLEADDRAALAEELSLTAFQRDGVARALRLLKANGGVLVADEVGLGKTYIAAEMIRKATEEHRQRVLVLAPAALKESMWEPFLDGHGFSRRAQCMSYDELRVAWQRNEEDTRRRLDDYALVIVDEAHNLRNPQAQRTETVAALVGGEHPKQVVLLTATPVNNSLGDLHALVSLFIRNDAFFAHAGIPSIRGYIAEAERIDPESLSPERLFDLLDRTTVRRTRGFVKDHYRDDRFVGPDGTEQTIMFPTPALHRLDYELDAAGEALLDAVTRALDSPDELAHGQPVATETVADPDRLILARYTPDAYRRRGDGENLTQLQNAGLLRCALLKCLESSAAALRSTLCTLIRSHEAFLDALAGGWVLTGDALRDWIASDAEDLDEHIAWLDDRSKSGAAEASEYRADALAADVRADLDLLERLRALAKAAADQAREPKSERLVSRLREVAAEARRVSREGIAATDRRKTIVFTSFIATVRDLQKRVKRAVDAAAPDDPLSDFRGRLPGRPIHGQKTGVDQHQRARVLGRFAPRTAGSGHEEDRYDILFATDVLSEGVNLQQAGRIVNYDLPWNPMRVVQRHGRIDRIGSSHRRIVLDCFFPASRLEELLDLEQRLRRKLALADAAVGTGDVLPGVDSGAGQVFSDTTRHQIMEIHDEDASILERGGQHRALSGEEYRHRLRQSMKPDAERGEVVGLPWASGSGFRNPGTRQSGFVFCIRVGQCRTDAASGSRGRPSADCEVCRRDPFFRFVPTFADWRPLKDGKGDPIVERDTLQALIAADPVREDTARELSSTAYDRAFDAWDIARRDVWEEWMHLVDPANLQPDLPKAFRDATELLHRHGAEALGTDELEKLIPRFQTVPTVRVQRDIRAILNADHTNEAKVRRLRDFALQTGLRRPTPVEPLPEVAEQEVHLVAWMAVRGGS
ncbi:MAG: SNF2-related protein [Acidobacteria bacterium]|nr:SNF2-related protein [Acidobacteriota bacterium]